MTDIRQISRRWHEAWGTPNVEAAYREYLFLSEFDHVRDCKVALGGSSLPVRQAGDARKPCLILLHGWPPTSLAWKGVLPKLGKDNCARHSICRESANPKIRRLRPRNALLPRRSSPPPKRQAALDHLLAEDRARRPRGG
ncbi:hypothetical protein NKH86_30505 [Mesorhizobium sp. M0913]|uniref:hypothetical protein n=1 Tax=Mesorhizobium sp. M0913 TaxID=2957026 RepID=UPI00333C4A83